MKKLSRGFTFVETVVVIALTALVMVTFSYMIAYFYKTNNYALQQSTAVNEARQGVRDAMQYLREASYGSDGSFPIQNAGTSTITFFANIDNDTAVEEITYSLQGGTFYRTVINPTGTPPSYVGQTPATSTIATSVVNATSTPVFLYYDDTGAQLAQPVALSKIASVSTTIVVDVNVNRAPVAFTLTSGATLRNLKDQQ